MSKLFNPRNTLLLISLTLIATFVAGLLSLPQQKASAASTVIVNGANTYQTIDGFGASGAFHVASVLHGSGGLSATQQQAILDVLFSQTTGAGLSILRNQIGSSADANCGTAGVGGDVCSIEPTAPVGGPGGTPTYVWDGSDADQIWLSQQAISRGVTSIYADAWSPPAYMKTNGSVNNGGYLCGAPGAPTCSSGDWRQHYANYLAQYVQNYKTAGITINYLGYQNEPDLSTSYTSANWDATNVSGGRGVVSATQPQNIDFIKNYLGPTLASKGLSTTKIACCDATYWNDTIPYANGILSDATAASYLGLVTGHGYYSPTPGELGANPITSALNAGKHVWESETCNFDPYNATWDGGSTNNSGYHWAYVIWDALVNAKVSAYLYWGLTWDNSSDNGWLVKVAGSTYEVPKRVWAFANYSRFIRPGATRIDATTGNSNLKVSAYKNTDGSYAIVALNAATTDESTSFTLQNVAAGSSAVPYLTNETNSTAQQTGIAISGGAFSATIPARSLVTYKIASCPTCPTATPAPPTGTPTRTPTSRPIGGGTGLLGQYFDNMDLTGLVLTRIDPTVDFNWGAGSPSAAIGADTFSARWTGKVQPLYSETYTFYTSSDDGSRVYINGALVTDNWGDHGIGEKSGTIALTAGQEYDIVVEYYDNALDAVMSLSWSSASQAKQVIPQAQLYPATTSATSTPGAGNTATITATPTRTNTPLVTNTSTPSRTNTPTSGPSLTPTRTPTVGISNTPSRTPTMGITNTPTRTPTIGAATSTPTRTFTPVPPTVTPTQPSGSTCSPVTSTITAPFTQDGAGTFCWQSSNLGTYINSWNLTSLTINGVNYTNLYLASGSYPAKINGYWYVSYNSTVSYSHFEAK